MALWRASVVPAKTVPTAANAASAATVPDAKRSKQTVNVLISDEKVSK